MKYEALFWIGVILAAPVWYMLARTFFSILFAYVWRSEKITLEIEDDNGNISKKVFYVNKSDDLVKLIDVLNKKNPHSKHRSC
ncbi:MAG: hypothetical protein COB09_02555 [Thalassobium sp.]|jgi:hypothetical protein|uniref:hypothetical protein n=1 Tax=Thalassolituus sp. ST750PaO-4 TaxID=2742965 RepID=UPI000C0E6E29|nr:hypothetical protein [Thalassolituus sp. ST750PaO-4]MCA6060689.1 hypothetical protein [Thalassolituus sp. ST750PaO-4]PHS66360.1 MAG: hypothetical protein COB09_02555 [Thalassobium sp.]